MTLWSLPDLNCFNESFPGIFQLGKVVSKLNVKNVPKLNVKYVKISSFQHPRLTPEPHVLSQVRLGGGEETGAD